MSATVAAGAVPRRPWVAAAISLFIPGLGHVYCGKGALGLAFFLIASGAMVAASYLQVGSPGLTFEQFVVSMVLLSLWLAFYVGVSVHAYRVARRIRDFRPKSYNHWSVYVGAVIATLCLNVVTVDLAGGVNTETFIIQTDSMSPALLLGDWIVVDKNAFAAAPPRWGEIVLHAGRLPDGRMVSFVRRIVGLPGDMVALKEGNVEINARHRSANSSTEEQELFAFDAMVPDGHVYVLNDDRSATGDSREYGLVPIEALLGKALYIYWSGEWSRIGMTVQ